MSSGNRFWIWIFLFLLSLIFLIGNIAVGSVHIEFADILKVLAGETSSEEPLSVIILQSRLPSALIAWVAGASLAICGLQMQTIFRNPVAGPYILGISSGASLGVAIVLLSGIGVGSVLVFSKSAILIGAALGSVSVFLLILIISWRVKEMTILLVIGLMIAGTIGAIISILQSIGSSESLQLFVFWTFGSFKNITMDEILVLLPFLVTGVAIAITQLKSLNVLLLGDVTAKNLGINLNRSRIWNIVGTCLLAGGITAFCGPIAFIGLAVPHISRMIFRTADHRILLPSSILIGASLGGFCNLLSSAPGFTWSLPLNAVTSIMGAPFVVWILFRIRKLKAYG